MELPEDNSCRPEANESPDELWAVDEGQQFSSSPDAGDMECARDQWNVEVVQGHASDAANRLSRAIDLLLDAAVRRQA